MSYPLKKLTEVCDVVYGFAFKADEFNEAGNGLPVIRISDVDKDKTDKFFSGKYDEKYIVNRGDILLGLSGSFKANRWSGDRALLNQRVATLRNFENKIAESFVFYQLPRLFRDLERMITQLSVKNILTKHIDSLRILYPPLEIQKQIVKRLDKIVEAQKLNDDLIQKSDELFQSLLHKELNPAGKGWKMRRLSEVGEIITGTTPSTKNSDYWNGKFLWATPTDIKEDTFILTDTPKKLSREGYKKTRPVPKNAILVTCIASIGKMALAGREMATNQQINSIVCNKDNDPLFIFFSLQKDKKKLINLGKTTAVPIINKSEFGCIKIPLPPLRIQKQIVAKLSAAQEYKTQLLAQKSKLKELFDSVLAKSFSSQ